jgi:hypothetical protein
MAAMHWLLLPLFLHVALTVWVGFKLGSARRKAVSSGRVKRQDITYNNRAWPDDILKWGSNFENQFQIPMLWYACIAFVLLTGLADVVIIVLSWLFLAARVVHTAIHTGSNKLPDRFYAFLAGFALLIAMWVWFGLRLFLLG